MTTALGIAAVTATLREMLRNLLVEHKINDILGVEVGVSALPPDRLIPASGVEASQLNLFLHRVSHNCAWRNLGLPARDATGRQRLSNAPLPLNLHFLLTAYCSDTYHAEVLLGFAMQLLHENPVLTREAIRTALAPATPPGTPLELALVASGLGEQIELVKITPEPLDTEEMSKLWTAVSSHMRPSAAYKATVVLIESDQPAVSPLPVLTRGKPIAGSSRDEGILALANLHPALPTLEGLAISSKQTVMCLGDTVDLIGHHLDGRDRAVELVSDRFDLKQSVPALAGNEGNRVQFSIPDSAAEDFPVGLYRIAARLVRPGETQPRRSNRLALTIAPKILGLPLTVDHDGISGTASFTLHFTPALRQGQHVVLILGQQEYEPQPYESPAVSLDFVIKGAIVEPAPGYLVRLRIDGIDSPIIDRTVNPPQFLPQRIVIL